MLRGTDLLACTLLEMDGPDKVTLLFANMKFNRKEEYATISKTKTVSDLNKCMMDKETILGI